MAAGKVKYHQLSAQEKKEYLGDFYSIIASLKSRDDVKIFFKDLLTLSEAVMISRRIQIAKMLLNGRTYDEIRKKLKVGLSNISQVERWLHNGFGGYKKVLNVFKNNKTNMKKNNSRGANNAIPYTFDWLRRKYPRHFALINILLKD